MADQSNPRSAGSTPRIRRVSENVPTMPDTRKSQPSDTVREQVGLYVAPRPLPDASAHGTLDLRPVRLSPDIDPRRAPTELRLPAPQKSGRRAGVWLLGGGTLLLIVAGALAWQRSVRRDFAPEAEPAVPVPVAEASSTPKAPAMSVPLAAPPVETESAPEPAERESTPVKSPVLSAKPKAAPSTNTNTNTSASASVRRPVTSPASESETAPAAKQKPRSPWME